MIKNLRRIKETLKLFSDEQMMITVNRRDLEKLVTTVEKQPSHIQTIAREIQYGQFDKGTLYCIKDGKNHVFSLSNYSWSLKVQNSRQLEEMMKYEGGPFGTKSIKTTMIAEMKDMMKELRPDKSKKVELER